jgi:hypothetical protein
MIKRHYFLGAMILGIFLGFFHIPDLMAGNLKPYVGFHGGINLTQPSIQQEFQIITLLESEEAIENDYSPFFRNLGYQIGFSLYLDFTDNFGIGLLPQHVTYSYSYAFVLDYVDSDGTVFSSTETRSEQKIQYVNIPLIAKYTIHRATWSPYVFAGFSYGIMQSASGNVVRTTTQISDNIVDVNPVPNNGSQVFIRSKLNLLGGAGIIYDFNQVQIGIDLAYWYGLHNIVHEGNRYSNQTVSGYTYDLPADTRLNHYVLNLMVLFPISKVENRGSLECVKFRKRR